MPSIFTKKDFINTKWFIAEKGILLIVGIFIVPKIFSTLGTSNIGDLKFVESILGMISPIFFLGLGAISIREIIYKPKKTYTILATTFYLQLVSWAIIFSGLLLYLFLSNETTLYWLYITIAISYLFRVGNVFEYYLQAVKWVKVIFYVKVISLIFVVSIQYYGVINNFDAIFFAKVIAFDFLIQGIMYLLFFYKMGLINTRMFNYSPVMAKYLLKSSLPLIISNLLISFYITIDELFLRYYHDSDAIGIFASVQFLVIVLTWNIGFSIINALYPSLADSFLLEDKKEYYKKMIYIFKLLSSLGVAIGLFYTFFGDFILSKFFSESYSVASIPLKVFSWAPLFIFTGMIFEKHLLNSKQLDKNVYRFLLGIIVNIILCYFLIPTWSVTGASISVLISHFVVNIGYILVDKESRNQLKIIVSPRI
ncbi:MAG: polysaccharide biosynthesis C-terminal domain-containing protein [Flavobacteriales bacterium]|nr:polysaccharide biosynthesis C-terminal domain-containing protein [Flavobacteriales bacterium]